MMNQLKKWIGTLLCAVLLIGALSGCTVISSGDDLLQLPRSSESFLKLQKQLSDIMGDQMTYTSPQSGSYRNSVIFEDVDKDGTEEAIAFLREGTGGSIYTYVFKLKNDEYEQVGFIEGPGSALASMSFLQLGDRELIVLTWTISGDVKQGLTVCEMKENSVEELLDANYTSYVMCDLDGGKSEELFTVSYDEAGRKTAQVYGYSNGKMVMLSQTDATQEVQTVANIKTGLIGNEKKRAVFVDNRFENDNGMQTDLYIMDNHKLRNIALSSNISTYRSVSLYYCDDVDGDGVIEVPQLQTMPGVSTSEDEEHPIEPHWMIDWYQYNEDGTSEIKRTTYENRTEGWKLQMPENWRGKVTVKCSAQIEENRTVFVDAAEPDVKKPILTIYVFTGEDRVQHATADGLIFLGETSDACYAADPGGRTKNYSLSEAEIKHLFEIVRNEWRS